MTAWTTIPATDYDAESPIDVDLMTAIVLNPTAITEGSAGAPKIQEAALDTAVVSQSKLKSTTAAGSVAINLASFSSYTLTGGTYSWWTASSNCPVGVPTAFGNGNTAAGVIGLANPSSSTITFYIDERYIQASPPYYLSDKVALFVFALIDNVTGEIVGLRVSEDPPWAYHGPTDIQASYYDDQGRPWRYERKYMVDHYLNGISLPLEQIKNLTTRDEGLWRLNNEAEKTPILITPEFKNRDMAIMPHWFGDIDLINYTPILFDPCGSVAVELMEILHSSDAKQAYQLIKDGYIIFDTTPLDCITPNGVITVAPKWKNTV